MRDALRSLRRTPLFAAVAVLSLGIALALNTTMFALVDAVVHPYVPFREPERLVTASIMGGDPRRAVSSDERFRAVRDGSRSYSAIAGHSGWVTSVESGSFAEDQFVAVVSPEFFDVLDVRPSLGRLPDVVDSGAGSGAAPTAVVSFRLHKRVFGGRALPAGAAVTLGGRSFAVVGVLPRGMHYPGNTDVWVADASLPAADGRGVVRGRTPVMRLKPGVTLADAQTEIGVIAGRLSVESGAGDRPFFVRVSPVMPRPWELRGPERAMLGAVAIVFLIACANLGTMLLARAMARRREIAIRLALGATRQAVVRMTLAECAAIAAAGAAVGVLLTSWAVWLLASSTQPYVPQLGDIRPVPSARVFAFALGISALTIALAGVLPALRASAVDPAEPLRDGAGSTGRVRDRYSPLVIGEVALATTLLMGAALMGMTTFRLDQFRFGYDAKRLLGAYLPLGPALAKDGAEVLRRFDDVLGRARRVPGVRSAALTHSRGPAGPIVISEDGPGGGGRLNLRAYMVVTPDFLRTFGIPIALGRDFAEGDRTGPGAVIVDENAAKRLWPGLASPVGRLIKLGHPASSEPWLRVVGVARAVEFLPRRDPLLPPEPQIYRVDGADGTRWRTLVVRAERAEDKVAVALGLRRAIREVLPRLGATRVDAWVQGYDQRRDTTAFLAALFAAFSAFALTLLAVGLYGTLAYGVSRRLREFAVRTALGATRWDVVRLVLHDAAVMTLAGIGLGAFVALAATRVLSDALYEVHHADVLALVAAEGVLALVALLACVSPARRAAGADPVEALRAN